MNKFRHLIPALLAVLSVLLQNCTRNDPAITDSAPEHYISIIMRAEAEGDGGVFNLQSLRLIVFDSKGDCAGNEFFSGSDYTYTLKDQVAGEDYWEVSLLSPMFVRSGAKNERYDIYAVLNENGFSSNIDENTSLGDRLTDSNLNKASFLDLLDTALIYEAEHAASDGSTEPAFIMSAYKTNVYIPPSATKKNPYLVTLDESPDGDQGTDRTMAMITVDRISGRNGTYETIGTNSLHTVSRIMVLDVSLVNIPDRYTWSNDASGTAADMITIPVAGDMSDTHGSQEILYYSRNWSGKVEQTVSATCEQKGMPLTDDGEPARIYNYKSNPGKGSWLIVTDPQVTGPPLLRTTVAPGNYNFNSGNFISYIKDGYLNHDMITWGEPEIEFTPSRTSVTGGDWDVPLNSSWYVPENITDSRHQATGLKITLALADPHLDGVDWNELDINWSLTEFTDQSGNPVNMNNDKELERYLQNNIKTCHADNPSVVIGDPEFDPNIRRFWYFLEPFNAVRKATENGTYSSDMNGVDTLWEVDEQTAVDFFVPISQDLNILRNTKYTIRVIVNDEAYDILQAGGNNMHTRSYGAKNPPIRLEVETAEMAPQNG